MTLNRDDQVILLQELIAIADVVADAYQFMLAAGLKNSNTLRMDILTRQVGDGFLRLHAVKVHAQWMLDNPDCLYEEKQPEMEF